MVLEAVGALRTLLGQGVGMQVADLIQELFPRSQRSPRLNLSVHSNLLSCLATRPHWIKRLRRGLKVRKARTAVAKAEDDLSFLQQEMEGIVKLMLIMGRRVLGRRGGSVMEVVGSMVRTWMECWWRRRIVRRKLESRLKVVR